MSKNLTRKGIAFGAVVALGTTLFAGAPAFAADELVLLPNTGTSFAAPVTETLTLNASLASSVPATNIAQLKYKIVTDGTFVAKAITTSAGASSTFYTNSSSSATSDATNAFGRTYVGAFEDGADDDSATDYENVGYVAAKVQTSKVVTPGTAPTAATINTIAVSVDSVQNATTATTGDAPTATTATRTATVTAWIDSDLDGVVDSGEFQKEQTVTFRKYSEITATTAVTAPVEGDTTVVAKVKFDNINNEQLTANEVGVHFSKADGTSLEAAIIPTALAHATTTTTVTLTHAFAQGDIVTIAGVTPAGFNQTEVATATVTSTTAFTTVQATAPSATPATAFGTVTRISGGLTFKSGVAWSATDFFKYTSGTIPALAKNAAVKVQPLLKGSALAIADFKTAAVASAATPTVTSRTVSTFYADTVQSKTAADSGDVDGTVTADVALNSTFQLKVTAKDNSSPAKGVSGVPVTAKVEVVGATLSSTVTVAVNGTVYSSAAKLPGATDIAKLAVGNTDAKGVATVTITTVGFTNGQDVKVTFYGENFENYVIANNATLDAKAYLVNGIDAITTTDGTAAPVKILVRDQFGNTVANSKYQVAADFVSSSQTTAATSASQTFANVTNSEATLSILDNGTGTGTNVYDLDLLSIGTNGALSSDENDFVNDLEIRITTAALTTAGEVTVVDNASNVISQDATTKVYTDALVASTGSGELLLEDAFANDGREPSVAAPDVTGVSGASIEGYVKTGVTTTQPATAIPGAQVTLSGAGLLFKTAVPGSKDVYAVGSITVYADKNGKYAATAWSNKSGKQTVKITSGSASATLVLSSFDAADDNAGTAISFGSTVSKSAAGRSVVIAGLVTDKFGNGVNTVSTADASNDVSTELLGDFALSIDGPGYLTSAEPLETDANGAFKVRLVLGASENGIVTVTAKYDANGDADYSDTGDVVATKTILIGITAGARGDVKGVSSLVKNASGATVKIVRGAKVATEVATSDSYRISLKGIKPGKRSVKVYVNDVLVKSGTVTVK